MDRTGEIAPGGYEVNTPLAVIVLTRPEGEEGAEWQELERGPGYIHIPAGRQVMVRAKGIDDRQLEQLVDELRSIPPLVGLNLSENRNVTDAGIARLPNLANLTWLNLSSCALTSTGLSALKRMARLRHLDLSYCNRLTDAAVKTLRELPGLEYIDLQGCVKITHGGLARLARRGLTIHK